MNKHAPHDLRQMQSLPLEAKILMTQRRIRDWYDHWQGRVYVSFSGGKDSTVLKHIVDSMYSDVPALFVNTGLEYPEIQTFVRDIKVGKYECFNSDVDIVRPELRFDEVIRKYGYPVVSKSVADKVDAVQRGLTWPLKFFEDQVTTQNGSPSQFNCGKWKYLLDAPFRVSNDCCTVMKKKPAKDYGKKTGRYPIIATMAAESVTRKKTWMKAGCNAFDAKQPQSKPLSFWTEADVLNYLRIYQVPYCSVYGDIVDTEKGPKTTGCDRTGCIFCAFGCHLEKGQNRFQRLKETHPRQYEYCIGGGEMVDGRLQPNKEGLGMGQVLDYIGVKYE